GVCAVVVACAGGVGQHGGAERVVGVGVGAADAFIDHALNVQCGSAAIGAFEADVHADFDKGVDDSGVLAAGAVGFGAHAAVDQDLRDSVFGGGGLLALVGPGEVLDVVSRVIVADV